MFDIELRSLAALRTLALLLIGTSCLVMVAAFIAICVQTGTISPWLRIVHEDGMRSLVDTIFYFDHAARELPIDLLLGLAVGGLLYWTFPPAADHPGKDDRAHFRFWTLAAVAVVLAIVVGTIVIGGVPLLIENLCQTQTRQSAPPEWGAHWRYHLLERVSLILISIGFAALLRGTGGDRRGRGGLWTALGSLAMFMVLTLIFSNGSLLFSQSFLDPLYIGHQARELFTHVLVTLPFAWGASILILVHRKPPVIQRSRAGSGGGPMMIGIMVGLIGILTAAYVCVASLMMGSASYGQSESLITLLAPHFFEHVFTYLVVLAVSMWTYEFATSRCRRA